MDSSWTISELQVYFEIDNQGIFVMAIAFHKTLPRDIVHKIEAQMDDVRANWENVRQQIESDKEKENGNVA